MISTTKTAETVITDALPGERREFTIAANGKAFRVLIDGLYEDKIWAVVRELVSNGFDAHAAQGCPEIPLCITAPTMLDPTFLVRDFGTSMDHETIMDLYSTIFASSKENTNDQVGMFGLGSKSPFAYTDTFSVTAYLNGEKRVYVAHIANGGVPQITHISTEPQGDEPQGIEVSIPVQPHDVHSFSTAIGRMIMSSDVAPNVDGMSASSVPEAIVQGDGWRVYTDHYGMGPVAVRQGCVIYPVHSMRASTISHGYTLVVDVPIGSVEVTASRESLSMTMMTKAVVETAVRDADEKVKAWAQALKFKNRLDAFQQRNRYNFLTFNIGRNSIKVNADNPNTNNPVLKKPSYWQTYGLQYMVSSRKLAYLYDVREVDPLIVIVENPNERVLRKNLRLAAYFQSLGRYSRKTIVIVQRPDLPRVVRILGLKPSQIKSLSSLPDVPVPTRPGFTTGSSTSTAGKHVAPRALPAGVFWMEKKGAKTLATEIGDYYIKDAESTRLYQILHAVGIKSDQVVFLTEKQAAALGASESLRAENEIKARAQKLADKLKVQDKLNLIADSTIVDQTATYGSGDVVKRAVGISGGYYYDNSGTLSRVTNLCIEEARTIFGVKSVALTEEETLIVGILEMVGVPSLTKDQITDKIKETAKPYAPLFKGDVVQNLLDFYINNK